MKKVNKKGGRLMAKKSGFTAEEWEEEAERLGDIYDNPTKVSEMFDAVKGQCAQCGARPEGGCEVGINESSTSMLAFCNQGCLGDWNVAHGLTPWGEVVFDD